jgi:hypothetical protein
MSVITINGKTYTGDSIYIKNGNITISGNVVVVDEKIINIQIDGNIAKLQVDACEKCVIHGDAGMVSTTSGDVEIRGNVTGNVKTMSGDVKCGHIKGDVSTMSGDIKNSK